jgi:hypothetical protein
MGEQQGISQTRDKGEKPWRLYLLSYQQSIFDQLGVVKRCEMFS